MRHSLTLAVTAFGAGQLYAVALLHPSPLIFIASTIATGLTVAILLTQRGDDRSQSGEQ